ncbi:MAG: hypothetical protein JW900_07650 [Anaerolineae bacterium]|nr:hypothetical protein [Anaerolineae bacterium]
MGASDDVQLLQRFEPIIRYTRGERFFPMQVEPYVRACSLWVYRPDEEARCLVPADELTIDHLVVLETDNFDQVHFLKFADPLSAAKMAVYNLKERQAPQHTFHAGRGRLARVGYLSRFIDAVFSLTLLARGRVRGDTAAAAVRTYQRIVAGMPEEERYCYYGRVIRQDGWIALQYWFFYAYNNWRSGFFGVNDHEADWEMVYVYLSHSRDRPESESGEIRPEWVAYASHDFAGDDLRRRWDDPELEKVGEHPVIYAGAGSHASYFTGGEYMIELEIPFLAPLDRVIGWFRSFWHKRLGQYGGNRGDGAGNSTGIFRIPFVDYARGDGVTIGPGQQYSWAEPCLLEPVPAWAASYRGLWGLYTRDPLGGENAPSGPVYNRDGTVRRSWYDPLGWAGMEKVPPPEQALPAALAQEAEVQERHQALEARVVEKTNGLKQLGLEMEAMRGQPHLGKLYQAHRQKIKELADEVDQLRAQMCTEQALMESLQQYVGQLQSGERGPLRAHIHHAHYPTPPDELRMGQLAEIWAAVSIGVMMLGFVVLFLFAQEYRIWGFVAIISLFVFVEAGFRRRLTSLLSSVAIGLSIVAVLVFLYEFFWSVVGLLVLIAGGYILWENLRELWR